MVSPRNWEVTNCSLFIWTSGAKNYCFPFCKYKARKLKLNFTIFYAVWGAFPAGTSSKEPSCQCKRRKRRWLNPWVGKIPWSRAWQPTPVFLPGESHGQGSLVGYSPWVHTESDMTEATWLANLRRGLFAKWTNQVIRGMKLSVPPPDLLGGERSWSSMANDLINHVYVMLLLVTQSCLTLDYSMSGFSVLHHLPVMKPS